jgi:hypothetical protein
MNKTRSKPPAMLCFQTERIETLADLKQVVAWAIAECGEDARVGYAAIGSLDSPENRKFEQFSGAEMSVRFLHGDRVVDSPIDPFVDVPIFVIGG